MGRLQDKVVMITGGGSGIGRATALLFASEGAHLAVTDIDGAKAEAVAAEARALSHNPANAAYGAAQDVTDEQGWQDAIAAVVDRYGCMDGLVNNAGIGSGGKALLESTLADFRNVQSVNLDGVFMGVRYGAEAMANTRGGSIINISSIYGIVGAPRSAAYCASKGGVRLLTKAAAYELGAAKTGIRVNSVHPGFIETPLIEGALRDNKLHDWIVSGHPIGRIGRPEEIAEACLYLASDASSFTTGSELVVDGGWTAR